MPEAGTQIAGYRLGEIIGRGGMSVVYLAEHVQLGRKVALKVLTPALAGDESFRERFIRESRLAAAIDHPNIIEIYDAGEAEEYLYISMRYVDGHDLKELIGREAPLPLGRTVFLLEQVANALDAAHFRGLIHRDVKPANILIALATDRVYLSDFGVVKHSGSSGLTQTGYFLGTVDYSAPEQIEGRPVDARTDVYALGCVLYECLTGSAPYKKGSDVAVMSSHLTDPPPTLTDARPDLPSSLNRVVSTAMAKSQDERYPTCGALINAVRAAALSQATAEPQISMPPPPPPPPPPAPETVVAGSTTPPEPPPPEPEPGPQRNWKLPALIAAVVALCAGGAAAAVLMTRDNGTSGSSMAGSSAMGQTSTGMNMGSTPSGGAPRQRLMGALPQPIESTCMDSAKFAGSIAGTSCSMETRLGEQEKLHFFLYPNTQMLTMAYDKLVNGSHVKPGHGDCSRVAWGGEGEWTHGSGEMGGRRFCDFTPGGGSKIVWTEEHTKILGEALDGIHPKLFTWWSFWVHEIG